MQWLAVYIDTVPWNWKNSIVPTYQTYYKKLSLKNNNNSKKYDIDTGISNVLDLMHSYFLLPYISSPTRIAAESTTLIDNLFISNYNSPYTSVNLVITLSDYHAHFLIMKNQPNLSESKKEDQLSRDFQELEKTKTIISEQLENME